MFILTVQFRHLRPKYSRFLQGLGAESDYFKGDDFFQWNYSNCNFCSAGKFLELGV